MFLYRVPRNKMARAVAPCPLHPLPSAAEIMLVRANSLSPAALTAARLSGARLPAPLRCCSRISGAAELLSRGKQTAPGMVMSTAAWPTASAFNALPQSTRSKIYSDYGDGGNMTWERHNEPPKHPLPPFTAETALKKTKAAEAAWNTRDPVKVSAAYTQDTVWRNRDEIFAGRDQVQAFLTRKWSKEQGYRLKKHLWSFEGNRISARFEYEWYDEEGQWYRTHGNEHWEFDDMGYMRWRDMSANDVPIDENERRLLPAD